MNKLQNMIQQLEEEPAVQGQPNLLSLLKQQEQTLNDHATAEEIDTAIHQAITDYLQMAPPSETNDKPPSEADTQLLQTTLHTIRQYLDSRQFVYQVDDSHPKFTIFYFGGRTEHCTLTMRIMVSLDYRTCCIEAVLPLSVDNTYLFPLCQAICRENYLRRYGALRYNEEDGVLSYRYNLPLVSGLTADTLTRLVVAVAQSASDGYLALKKHCLGHYESRDTEEILESMESLTKALIRKNTSRTTQTKGNETNT